MTCCIKIFNALKKEIKSREDIVLLVDEFYRKIKQDELIGPVFTDVAKVDWAKHLPIMYDFFENILFYTGSYSGNPMELHQHISRIFPFTEKHFKRWNHLFNSTLDDLFTGSMADVIKLRIMRISDVMKNKIIDEHRQNHRLF